MIDVLKRIAAKWEPEWREEFEERVAIVQHLGNLDEDTAYREAFACVGERRQRFGNRPPPARRR